MVPLVLVEEEEEERVMAVMVCRPVSSRADTMKVPIRPLAWLRGGGVCELGGLWKGWGEGGGRKEDGDLRPRRRCLRCGF